MSKTIECMVCQRFVPIDELETNRKGNQQCPDCGTEFKTNPNGGKDRPKLGRGKW